jgi:hypothetical protein
MINFEIAAKLAFEQIFPNCIFKGCLFHFSQSLFKKLALIGWKKDYLENIEFQIILFKSIVCLALIPINNVYQIFEILINDSLQNIFPGTVSSNCMGFFLFCDIFIITFNF